MGTSLDMIKEFVTIDELHTVNGMTTTFETGGKTVRWTIFIII